jgi:hypothetical protein
MFTLEANATLRHRDKLRQSATEWHESLPAKAATPATPATNVATVAMSHVAEGVDQRLRQPDFRRAVIAARDAAYLPDFKHALQVGALHVCCNCAHYTFNADPAAPGQCRHFNVEAVPFMPFLPCSGFLVSGHPVAPNYLPETPR